jgi:hypothetical protein
MGAHTVNTSACKLRHVFHRCIHADEAEAGTVASTITNRLMHNNGTDGGNDESRHTALALLLVTSPSAAAAVHTCRHVSSSTTLALWCVLT